MTDSARPDIAAAFRHLATIFDFSAAATMPEFLAAARAGVERYGDLEARAPLSGVTITRLAIGEMAAEWIAAPDCDTRNRILYIHGGGILTGSLESHRPIAAELARQSGFAVLVFAYRLAPEHVFPAAHDDCAAAFAWLQGNTPQGASDAQRVFIAGDSMGGQLAAALCAQQIAQERPIPAALAFLGGTLDSREHPARPDLGSDPIVTHQTLAGIQLYAPDTPRNDPRLCAMTLADTILARFPPVLLQASTIEYVLPDAQAFGARLASLDRRAVVSTWPGLPHVWHYFVASLPEAKAAIGEVAGFFRQQAGTTKW